MPCLETLSTLSSTECGARQHAQVFAVPPWHLLTLVPHAALASVWPLMRPSHAGRQIREPRLPASISNWSPQLPDLLLQPVSIGRPRREATSTSSVIAGILVLVPSRPSGFYTRPHSTAVCYLQLADSKYHERAWAGAGSLEPCLNQQPNRTQNGDAPENRRAALCFFLHICSATHAWEVVMHHKASRPSPRNLWSQLLINPALPRVQTNKPQPCWPHVASASAWVWGTATIPV